MKSFRKFLRKISAAAPEILAGTLIAFFAGTAFVPAAENVVVVKPFVPENDTEAARVIVVANSADKDSLALARYYMQARAIPESNLVAFPMPKTGDVTWKEFAEIFSTLRREFVGRGYIDGSVFPGIFDKYGRQKLFFPENYDFPVNNSVRIAYVVLCRGVPLRIKNEESFLPKNAAGTAENAGTKQALLDVNCASVDSEIALLGVPETPINGAVYSPFFKENLSKNLPRANLFLRVARLDGITLEDAKSLVDSALAAERDGLLGCAYIDIGGPHKQGDKWLEECAAETRALGFDTSVERSRALMDAASRYDAPALYFGWYAGAPAGFFRDPNFRFPAGAIAIHIYSFSAVSMRSKNCWTPALVHAGAAATVGNVWEPYLGMTHWPHLFLEALANGESAGAAAAYSLPVLSWQNIFVGDPLYRPFTQTPNAQIDAALAGTPTRLSQYAFMRAANAERNLGHAKKADALLQQASLFAPGLALNYLLLEKEIAEKGASARRIPLSRPEAENPGLLHETAKLLAKNGRAGEALEIYALLLDRKIVPEVSREKVLRAACELARSRGDTAHFTVWQTELDARIRHAEKVKKDAAAKKAAAEAEKAKKAEEAKKAAEAGAGTQN